MPIVYVHLTLHGKNGTWIIHGGTQKITVYSSATMNYPSVIMNYPSAVFSVYADHYPRDRDMQMVGKPLLIGTPLVQEQQQNE